MTTAPQPLFDMSKAVPIQPAQGMPLFDMSKAQPIQQPQAQPIPSNATISAQPKSTGWLNDVENTLRDAGNDVRYGTGTTGLGRLLQYMGATGTSQGSQSGAGEFMGSPLLGTLRAGQGAAELPQSGKTWQGTKDVVGGTLEAAQIPGAFMGGPSEAGADALTAGTGKLFGDVEKAGKLFSEVAAATRDKPIELSDDVYDALTKIKQLSDAGAKGTPRVASRLANRLNNIDEELYWDEARRFYSNISRLSANEYNSMAPQMQRAVGELGRSLNDVLQTTADSVDKGDEYAQAMQLYAKAKSWQKFGSDVWTGMKKALPFAGGTAAGQLIGHKLSELFTGE
jgi:hypothetical protein